MTSPRVGLAELPAVELAALGLLAVGAALAVPLYLVVGLAGVLTAGHWPPLTPADLAAALAGLPGHLRDPGGAFPRGVRGALPGPWGFAGCTVIVIALLCAATLLVVRVARRHASRAGYAAAGEVRTHLSAAAVVRRGRHTRPSLTGRVTAGQVGLALGHDVRSGQALWGSVEDSYLYLGPPRAGKGVHLIIPQTLDAPGPLLVTATRPDTLRHTLGLRASRGPVLAFDPQRLAGDVPRLRWAPHRGCEDPLVAIARARALAAGGQPGPGTAASDVFWQQMTEAVLRCYLHAAALAGRPVRDVLTWATRPADPTPLRILRCESGAAPGWTEELAAQIGAEPKQRDSVWAGVRRAVDSLADPRVLDTCSPGPGEAFDPASFLAASGALYLVGTSGTQLSVAPLVTALVEDLVDAARRTAATCLGGRLDPPLLLLLDEAANIAPLPSLPNLLADGGGSGITTVAVLQSLAQARARWGEAAADALWDAATTKVILGGLAHADDLGRISRLAGEIDQPTRTHTRGSGGPSVAIAQRRLPALPVETIRTLGPGRAIVLARHSAPVLARLDAWWRRPDADAIRQAAAGTL
jgi:hypothetical protein